MREIQTYERAMVRKYDPLIPPSFDDMEKAIQELPPIENNFAYREYQEYNIQVLQFKNALQVEKISKDGDTYTLTLPKNPEGEDNIIKISVVDDSLVVHDDMNLNYLHGDLVLLYVKECDVTIKANNAQSVFLPHTRKAWEIIANGAQVFKAPCLEEVDWKLEITHVKDVNLQTLKKVDGVISLPNFQYISSSAFIFPQDPISVKGVSFKLEKNRGKNEGVSMEPLKEKVFKEMAQHFRLSSKSAQLYIEPDEEYLFSYNHTSLGICNSDTCMKPGKPLFWQDASNYYGEVLNDLQVYVLNAVNNTVEKAALVIFPDQNITYIGAKSIVENPEVLGSCQETFRLAIEHNRTTQERHRLQKESQGLGAEAYSSPHNITYKQEKISRKCESLLGLLKNTEREWKEMLARVLKKQNLYTDIFELEGPKI
ncbi:hypothetical protein HON22_02010 [Candidatus Peregrinibacteria bacterium]|jgi:hypothetical protein|nr:hypothetical protein [Candidatus Peregrinibacteria bacterium]